MALGSTTYSSVTWTSGDVITEAKLDAMVANDQAYDSHAAEGILLNNNTGLYFKNAAGTNKSVLNYDGSDIVQLGVSGNKTYLNTGYYGPITADSDAATITFNMATSNIHTVTLGDNRTLAVSNTTAGQVFLIRLLQDGTGSRTVTWFSTIKWVGGSAPTLTTTASKADMFGFLCTSTNNYDGYVVGQNL